MKTTVVIADALLDEAKAVAAADNVPVRVLIEEGLRLATARRKSKKRYKLPDLSFKGSGVAPGVDLGDWNRIRDLIYETSSDRS